MYSDGTNGSETVMAVRECECTNVPWRPTPKTPKLAKRKTCFLPASLFVSSLVCKPKLLKSLFVSNKKLLPRGSQGLDFFCQ